MPQQEPKVFRLIIMALVRHPNGAVLLTQWNQPGAPQHHELWSLPSGSAKLGEDPRRTAERSTYEDTGFTVIGTTVLLRYHSGVRLRPEDGTVEHIVVFGFSCLLKSGRHREFPEGVKKIKWVLPDQLYGMPLSLPAKVFLGID